VIFILETFNSQTQRYSRIKQSSSYPECTIMATYFWEGGGKSVSSLLKV